MKISVYFAALFRGAARRRGRKNVYAQAGVENLEAKQPLAGVNASAAEVLGVTGQDAQQQAPVSLDVVIKDANGNPTSQINPGDEFLVEVSARDNRENAQGIFTVYTDVKYDTSLIDVLSAETAPGVSASGTINDPDGLVDDVNRLFFTGSASGPVAPLLFTLRAKATGEGALTIATAQAAVGGHQQVTMFGVGDDLREQTEYGSATVQIGAPKVTLQQAPSINEDGQSLDVVVNYSGAGVDADDFNGATLKAVRKSDGATLNAQLVDVEPLLVAAVVGQQPAFDLKFKLDAPAGGFDFEDNGTWDLLPTSFPGDVDETESLGTFEIDLTPPPPPAFETGLRFTDLAGNTLSIIQPGQQFRIEVSAKDLRDLDDAKLLGLLSAAYDLEFDTDLIDIVSIDQKYSLAPRGEIFEDEGLVDGAGGFFGLQAPGTADAVDVVEVIAVARRSGTLNVTATPDESPFAAFEKDSRVAIDVRDNVPSATASIVIAAPLELSVSQPTLSENGGTATLTVTRGGSDISQDVRVDLTASDTSELSVPEFVIIKADETSATVTIEGKDDNLLDGTQNVVVSGIATGFTEGTVNVDVTDHEVITASFNPDQVREDGGSVTLTITRSDVDDLSQPVEVKLSVPQEFQGQLDLPETATIAAGKESIDVIVMAIDNAIEDGDRTFDITFEAIGFEGGSDDITIQDVEYSDVVVSKFDAVNDRIDGGTVVRLTVTNNGTGTARNFNVAIVHSDDQQIGNSDDQTRITLPVAELAPGESIELTTAVDFDVATLVERFIAENNGNPGEVAQSKMIETLGAVADSGHVLEERNADGTAETNNSGTGQGKDMDDVTALPFDLDGDNVIAALDGLEVINNIGQLTTHETAAQDTDNDGFISPLDAATYIGHFGISLNDEVQEPQNSPPNSAKPEPTATQSELSQESDPPAQADDNSKQPEIEQVSELPKPIAHFSFDGNAGNQIEERPDGRVSGGVTFVEDGRVGGAAEFNRGAIHVSDEGLKFSHGDTFTYAAWIKVDDLDEVKPIFDSYRTGLKIMPDEVVNFWTHDGKFRSLRSETPISVGEWHHVAASYQADGTMTLYVDGELAGTLETNGLSNYPTVGPYVGHGRHMGGQYFAGLIDDAKVFDVALTAEQVRKFVEEHEIQQDENVGSLKFDGENDVAVAGNTDSLQIANDMTVSTWINPDQVDSFQKFISKGDREGSLSWTVGIRDGKLNLGYSDDGSTGTFGRSNVFETTADVLPNQWSHIAWTFKDGVNHLYLNGEEVTLTQTKGPGGTRLHTGTTLQIGKEGLGDRYLRHFDGQVAETSIWKMALSGEQVVAAYNDGVAPDLSSHQASDQLVSWWSMQTDEDGNVIDRVGNNQLTLVGFGTDALIVDSGLQSEMRNMDGSLHDLEGGSSSQETSLTVTGKASIFQALGGDESTAAVEVEGVSLKAGSILTVSASGSAGRTSTSGLEASADGSVSEFVSHAGGSLRGIADVKAPFSSLVVVFTGDSLSDTAPPALDFSEIGLDYQRIAPQLQQPVFVGDGNTAGGSSHEIVVPEGAKHAYFGAVDITNWPNNQGSINVKVTVSDASKDDVIDEAFSGDLTSKL